MERYLIFLVSVSFRPISGAINLESSSYIQIDKGRYLSVTKDAIHSIFVLSPDECRMKCVRTLSCLSLNLATVSDDNGMVMCEMLSTNKYEFSTQLKPNKNFHHYTVLVSIFSFLF